MEVFALLNHLSHELDYPTAHLTTEVLVVPTHLLQPVPEVPSRLQQFHPLDPPLPQLHAPSLQSGQILPFSTESLPFLKLTPSLPRRVRASGRVPEHNRSILVSGRRIPHRGRREARSEWWPGKALFLSAVGFPVVRGRRFWPRLVVRCWRGHFVVAVPPR